MKKNHVTVEEAYALLDGLTEEQLDRILMYIDKIIKEDDGKKGEKQE